MHHHSNFRTGSGLVACLAPGVRVVDVADACRSAALGFAWGGSSWSKRELATWLIGPYARATAAARALRVSGVRRAVERRTVDEQDVRSLVARAHANVMETLRSAWSWQHDASFARAIVADGLVGGVIDDASGIGYAPIDQGGMSLARRVESLFLADYLTRPADYAAFAICPECEGATFDGGIYHTDCARPRSVTVLRRREERQDGNGIPAVWKAVAI